MNETDRSRRERDRARKAAERLRKGMTPNSKRDVVRRMGEIAADSGVSISTLYRHRKAGTLDAFLFDPDSLKNFRPSPSQNFEDRNFSQGDRRDVVASADKSFSNTHRKTNRDDEHSKVVAKLMSEAEAARFEWLDYLAHGTPWP